MPQGFRSPSAIVSTLKVCFSDRTVFCASAGETPLAHAAANNPPQSRRIDVMRIAHARFIIRHAQAVAALFATVLLAACDPAEKASTPVAQSIETPPLEQQLRAGEKAYEMHCAQCHYAGEGGANVPPLAGSPVLQSEPAATFKVILHGQRGQSVVNGKKFNGIMPAMSYLSDDEIAAVTAYLRQRFADKSEALNSADVAKARR
jgi:mono/diheme cytochrome c family protein